MNKKAVSIAFLLVSACVGAMGQAGTIYTTTSSTVTQVQVYSSYGGGDVIFFLASNSLATSCPYGFWIRATDAGAKSVVSQVLAAYTAGTPVAVSADTSTTWSGAGSASCLVWNVTGT
jgi:hypothetical protein